MAILTISRMFGAGARELGASLAGRLGYAFFDHELIQMVADLDYRIDHIRKRFELTKKQALLAVAMEDKRRVNLYRKLGKLDYNQTDHYHVVFNMRRTETQQACDMLCALLAGDRPQHD